MDSYDLKNRVLHYFRFNRRYNLIATEVGSFNSDILVSNNKEIIEVEIKTSKADLKNDFKKTIKLYRKRILKHEYYKNGNKSLLPNKFYFGLPNDNLLIKVCLELIEKNNQKYGIIIVNDNTLRVTKKGRTNESYCTILRPAKPLHDSYSNKLHRAIYLRTGSELIRERFKLSQYIEYSALFTARFHRVKLKIQNMLAMYRVMKKEHKKH